MKKIFSGPEEFLAAFGTDRKIYATSGGFDPMHVGHLRCIQETVDLARFSTDQPCLTVIIVNGDGFLARKKGKHFMPHEERMEIVAGIEGVDAVVGWDDGTQTVEGCIRLLRPVVFAKGGDTSSRGVVPESQVCDEVGCKIIFGVGGSGKAQSSSDLIGGKDVDLGDKDRITVKPWGYELLIVKAPQYAAKILGIDAGKRLSKQYHNVKDETIHVVSGLLRADIGESEEPVFIPPGGSLRITPGTIHRFCAPNGNVRLFEVSTPELDDVVRITDDFGRK